MRDKNICKFISPSISDKLLVSHFIIESNPIVMREEFHLNNHRVILVTQGKGNFLFNNMQVPFNKGDLIFGFENEIFSAEFDGECIYMYISFEGGRAEELLRRFDINKNNRSFSGFEGIIPLWQESLSRASEETIDLATESILLYTFSRIFGNTVQQSSLISKIIEISEESFTEPDLSITLIAEQLSYNAKYLSHIFKEKMGMSYSEYLRTLRLKFAISLFEHGIESVKNVALLSGFADPLYFSTVFKKNVGVSPKEYKNNLSKSK